MATSYHMVHYRRFSAQAGGQRLAKLDTLCRNALSQVDASGTALWQRAQDRVYALTAPDGRQIVLNKVADLASAVFGEMCLIQDGGFQALLELRASQVQLSNLTVAEIFSLNERSAPQGSQFVRGMIYWLAIGDHLFFVKTQSMTADHLKDYLGWLLANRTGALPAGSTFNLQAEFDRAQFAGDIGDIRSLRVSGGAAPMTVAPAQPPTEGGVVATARRVADRFVEFAQAVPVVEALFGQTRTQSLLDSLGPDEYLAVDASVKVRGRRTAQSREKLKQIANDLADMTEGKVQIEGKDGKVSDEDAILRTRMPFSLAHEGSNFLEFDNVADQLQEVYSRFVHDGKIQAE